MRMLQQQPTAVQLGAPCLWGMYVGGQRAAGLVYGHMWLSTSQLSTSAACGIGEQCQLVHATDRQQHTLCTWLLLLCAASCASCSGCAAAAAGTAAGLQRCCAGGALQLPPPPACVLVGKQSTGLKHILHASVLAVMLAD